MSSSKTTGEVRPNGEQFVEIAGRNGVCYCSSAVVPLFEPFRHGSPCQKRPLRGNFRWEREQSSESLIIVIAAVG
jgi:hypothetical protein